MTALNAIKLGFKKSLNYKSRASRSEFWWFFLFSLIVYAIDYILYSYNLINLNFAFIIFFIVFLPFLAVLIRRLHDRNRSAYIIIAPLIITLIIAFIGVGFSFIFENYLNYMVYTFYVLCGLSLICISISCIKKGTSGDNDYGPEPQ